MHVLMYCGLSFVTYFFMCHGLLLVRSGYVVICWFRDFFISLCIQFPRSLFVMYISSCLCLSGISDVMYFFISLLVCISSLCFISSFLQFVPFFKKCIYLVVRSFIIYCFFICLDGFFICLVRSFLLSLVFSFVNSVFCILFCVCRSFVMYLCISIVMYFFISLFHSCVCGFVS